MKFEWTPNISVGNETLDNQHQKLLEQINFLLEAIMQEKDVSVIKDNMDFLDAYTDTHFKYEEKYMEDNNYPEIRAHKEIHAGFIKKYEDFKENLEKVGPTKELMLETQTFLGNWWVDHITIEDKKYADFIKQYN